MQGSWPQLMAQKLLACQQLQQQALSVWTLQLLWRQTPVLQQALRQQLLLTNSSGQPLSRQMPQHRLPRLCKPARALRKTQQLLPAQCMP